VHHIWACDHYKTTLNASEFKRVYKRRTDMVKDAIDAVLGRPRGSWSTPSSGDQRKADCSRWTWTSSTPDRPERHVILPAASRAR
jgi:hypothetical protein